MCPCVWEVWCWRLSDERRERKEISLSLRVLEPGYEEFVLKELLLQRFWVLSSLLLSSSMAKDSIQKSTALRGRIHLWGTAWLPVAFQNTRLWVICFVWRDQGQFCCVPSEVDLPLISAIRAPVAFVTMVTLGERTQWLTLWRLIVTRVLLTRSEATRKKRLNPFHFSDEPVLTYRNEHSFQYQNLPTLGASSVELALLISSQGCISWHIINH